MQSQLERSALVAGLLVLTASLQFGFGILHPAAALVGALLLGVGTTLLWTHFDLPTGRPWLLPLLICGAVLLSTIVLELAYRSDFASWFAFVFAGIGSGTCLLVTSRTRARCSLCNRRLNFQSVRFRCPRCSMEVCDETCWNFEHRRCELCLEHRVPVLPIAEAWWTRATGPRARQGRCLLCLASADQADLRTCPNCRRTQCRSCWDFNNGECSRCSAPLADLPPALSSVIAGTPNAEPFSP